MTSTPHALVRDEVPDDLGMVRSVTIDAFSNSEFGHNGEADLVDTLREAVPHLSLVAVQGDLIVGHILFTPVEIRSKAFSMHGMGLAPMSVSTNCQRQGIGSQLISESLKRLKDTACEFVAVLGHPEYYSRFGFVPAADCGVQHGFAGIPQDVFFIRWLSQNTTKLDVGRAFYSAEFGPQHIET